MQRTYKKKEGVQIRVCSWAKEQPQSASNQIVKNTTGITTGLKEISRKQGTPRCYVPKNKRQLTLGMY